MSAAERVIVYCPRGGKARCRRMGSIRTLGGVPAWVNGGPDALDTSAVRLEGDGYLYTLCPKHGPWCLTVAELRRAWLDSRRMVRTLNYLPARGVPTASELVSGYALVHHWTSAELAETWERMRVVLGGASWPPSGADSPHAEARVIALMDRVGEVFTLLHEMGDKVERPGFWDRVKLLVAADPGQVAQALDRLHDRA